MIYPQKTIRLKGNQRAEFRSPTAADAADMLHYLKTCAQETEFILRYPEECVETPEQEAEYLERVNQSETDVMIAAFVNGVLAGNCQLMMNKRLKTKHRAMVAIGLVQQYWNMGIGTAMFREMIAIAKENGVSQLELEYIEGNDRARHLYEKMGFVAVAEHPNAVQLKDGTMRKEILMIKQL